MKNEVRVSIEHFEVLLNTLSVSDLKKCSSLINNYIHNIFSHVKINDLEYALKISSEASQLCVQSEIPLCVVSLLNELSDSFYRLEIDKQESKTNVSDEIWHYFCLFIEKTICCLTYRECVDLFDETNFPLLAHVYSLVLSIVQSQRAFKVRLQAINTILALLKHTDLCFKTGNHEILFLRPLCFSKVFPGFSQCLVAAILGERGRNSLLKSKALNAWSELIVTCLSDSSLKLIYACQDNGFAKWITDAIPRITAIFKQCSLSILSDREIAQSSRSALQRLYSSLACLSSDICLKCWSSVNMPIGFELRDLCISSLISVHAFADSNCPAALFEIKQRQFNTQLDHMLVGYNNITINGGLYILDLALALIFSTAKELEVELSKVPDERHCMVLLDRIHGILQFLGTEKISSFIENGGDCLKSLVNTIASLLFYDIDSYQLIDSISADIDPCVLPSLPHSLTHLFTKYFLHFRQPTIMGHAEKIISGLVPTCSAFDLLTRVQLDLIEKSSSNSEPAFLHLFAASFHGLAQSENVTDDKKIKLAIAVIEELAQRNYLRFDGTTTKETSVLSLPSGVADAGSYPVFSDSELAMPLTKLRSLNACIFMEILASASRLWISTSPDAGEQLYPEELQPLLLQVLSVATGDGLLASTARHSLLIISKNCGFSCLSDFVSFSSGPLLSSLTLDFHRVMVYACVLEKADKNGTNNDVSASTNEMCARLTVACNVLTFFAEHANQEAIHRIRPLVMQMLMCLDVTYDFAATFFLPVLKKIISACFRVNSTPTNQPPPTDLPQTSLTSKMTTSFLHQLKYRSNDPMVLKACFDSALTKTLALVRDTRQLHSYAYAENHITSTQPLTVPSSPAEDRESIEAHSETSEDTPTVYPDQIRLVEEIMLRSIHLMSCDTPKLRIASMSLLCEGCQLLKDHEDLLLPLVHKIWSSLLSRMRDRHPAVVEKAFELFSVLASVSRSFIRARASSDLVNSLVTFLDRGVSVSLGEPSSYEFLTACRIQKRLLYAFGNICVQLELFSTVLRPVVVVLAAYLDARQPAVLREASASSLLKLYELDPGLVSFEITSKLE